MSRAISFSRPARRRRLHLPLHLRDGKPREVGDVPVAEAHGQRLRPQPLPVARRGRPSPGLPTSRSTRSPRRSARRRSPRAGGPCRSRTGTSRASSCRRKAAGSSSSKLLPQLGDRPGAWRRPSPSRALPCATRTTPLPKSRPAREQLPQRRAPARRATVSAPDGQLDGVLLEPVQARPRRRGKHGAVHAQVREPFARGPGGEVRVVALARRDERGEDADPLAPVVPQDPRGRMASGALRLDRDVAVGAVLRAELHEQQPQERVDLRERGHGALPAAAAGALLDGHGGRNAVHPVHVGPARGLHELPRVRVEGFQVPALALGKEDVEGDGALAAAAHARDDAEASRGMERSMFFRLCSRACRMTMALSVTPGQRRRCAARALPRRRASPSERRQALTCAAPRPCGSPLQPATCRGRARADHSSARLAALRPQVDDPVRGPDHVEVVLDDHHGMARGNELAEGAQERGDVVEVQARGGLVEEEEGAPARAALAAPPLPGCARYPASFSRCASPPLSVGTGCPRLT